MLRVVMLLDAEAAGRYFGPGLTAGEYYVGDVSRPHRTLRDTGRPLDLGSDNRRKFRTGS
jgi:hypothetical protein